MYSGHGQKDWLAYFAKRWRRAIMRLMLFQLVVVGVITLLMLWISMRSAYSALVAGTVCLVANGVFIMRWFRTFSPANMRHILVSFARYELLKLVIIVTLTLLAMTQLHVSVVPFLVTYFLLQFSLLFAPIILTKTLLPGRIKHGT